MGKRFLSNIISRWFGKFANHPFPPFFQKIINSSYVKLLNLDMSEFKSANSYETLNALFIRKLEKKREFSSDEKYYISPSDSLITQLGDVKENRALQIKGMDYSVNELLKECSYVNLMKKFINFYLSPRDYHRFHMPYTLQILKVVHIPGRLYPVNFRYLNKKPNLFIENERVVLECKTKDDKVVYIVLVGALNVGQIDLVFENRLKTNKADEIKVFEYENLWLKKGELLGYFKMGSTIVLFFEENLDFLVKINQKVLFGQNIARRKHELSTR